jgi:STE24 endopeptidase
LSFDPQAATAAYIDSIGAEALAKSAAYTTGSHWLILWGLVVAIVVAWLIVRWGLLERVDARLQRRGPNLRAWLVGVTYFLCAGLLSLPWSLYEDWWRQVDYGRSSQPFADALSQALLGVALTAVIAALFFTGVYALMRRTGRRWWIWSGALSATAVATLLLVAPVAIQPLFNEYKPLPEGPVREALRSLADQAGIPADRILVYDGSRQSNNFTANVSGLGPYKRIAISDVALKGASLDEVRAVTAHEIGHYRLHHVWRQVALFAALLMVSFFVADRLYPRLAALLGSRAPIASPTSLPVILVLVSILLVLATPLVNTMIRLGESEADRYSLETVDLPDALATALVKTAEYRYPRPGPVQEFLFYSHPSVERRVRAAMDWKAGRQ